MSFKKKRMIMDYYPIAVRLKGKRVVAAGGGKVAERKVGALLSAGSCVKVVSPVLTAALELLARSGKIRWIARAIRRSDLRKASIVIAATSDTRVNRKISLWAREQKALVNIVDNPSLSDFISPAVFKKQRAIITVYTDGRDPALSRDLKNFLKEKWDVFLSYRDRL